MTRTLGAFTIMFLLGGLSCGSSSGPGRRPSARGECPPGRDGAGETASASSLEPGGCGNGDRTIALDTPCDMETSVCRWSEPFRLSTFPRGYAVGATDDEVALAVWSSTTTAGPGCFRVARYDAELRPISMSGCLGPEDAWGASLARTSGGWLVMITGAGRGAWLATVYRLVEGATALEETFAAPVTSHDSPGSSRWSARLVGRPTGGPLAVWTAGGETHAALLAEDGSFEGEPTILGSADPMVHGAAWTGEAFVLLRYGGGRYVLSRVPVDGSAPTDHPVPLEAEEPTHRLDASFAWGHQVGRLVAHVGDEHRLVHLGTDGSVLGEPIVIPAPVPHARFGPMVTLGDEVVVLERDMGPLHAVTTPSPLRLTRIALGEQPSPLIDFTRDPFPPYRDWFDAVPMGADALILWSATRCTSQYVGLARVAAPSPPPEQQQ